MLDHVSLQCSDVAASAAFYDAVLAQVGGARVPDFGETIGYGQPPMADPDGNNVEAVSHGAE